MPSPERTRTATSQNPGSPPNDDAVSPVTRGRPSLEQVLLSTVTLGATHTTMVDDDEDSTDAAPTSWSFAARQRSECARIARVFRYARHRIRQELRGIALDHTELLLGLMTRTVATIAAGTGPGATSGASSARGTTISHLSQGRPQMEDGGHILQGERDALEDNGPFAFEGDGQGGGKKNVRGSGRNLRHEARPQDVWNKRWAMAVDEDSMEELSTLALDESMLEGDSDAGLEATAGVGARTLVEWRKAFRQRVISSGGTRHQRERSANRRCKRNSVRGAQWMGFCFSLFPAFVAFDQLDLIDDSSASKPNDAEQTLPLGVSEAAPPLHIDEETRAKCDLRTRTQRNRVKRSFYPFQERAGPCYLKESRSASKWTNGEFSF